MEKLFKLLNKIPYDKSLHAVSGVFIFVLLHLIISIIQLILIHFEMISIKPFIALSISAINSILIVLSIGIAKEIYDGKHPDIHTKDWWDAIATTSGGLIGLAASIPSILYFLFI